VSSGVKEVREIIARSKGFGQTVLFIDEIHRFNKGQQDALLGAVEKGYIRLIGATTENPSFEVNSALLSRCQVYTLNAFSKEELLFLLEKAMTEDKEIAAKKVILKETDALLQLSGGDGRRLLNNFEVVVEALKGEKTITNDFVSEVIQQRVSYYDKGGDVHYDIISAFIKSIRGSDPNAAVYWLARMIEGGEDPKFIARRLLISASEDVGIANPTAIVMANNCFQAVNVIGYPEARIILSQCTIYLASSAKSNAAYEAINKAQQLIKKEGDLPVPLHLRGGYTKLNRDLGYGKEYKYAHAYPGNFVSQEYLPEDLSGVKLYEPGNNAREKELRTRLKALWNEKYGY
jgi:putative ATPase